MGKKNVKKECEKRKWKARVKFKVRYLECEHFWRFLFEVQARESRGCSLLTSAFDVDSKATKSAFLHKNSGSSRQRKGIFLAIFQMQNWYLCGCRCLSYLCCEEECVTIWKLKDLDVIGTVTNCFHTRPPTPFPPHLLLLSSLNCGIYDPDCSGAFSDSIHPWSKAHCWQDGSLDWRKNLFQRSRGKDNPKLIHLSKVLSTFSVNCN